MPHRRPLSRPTLLPVTRTSRRARWRWRVLRRLLAVVALAVALIAAWLTLRPPPPQLLPVAHASRDLDSGEVLTAGDIVVRGLPAGSVPPGAVAGAGDLVGRSVTGRVASGEALTATRLVPRTAADGLPPGKVAVHLTIADERSLTLISPGMLVTVYPVQGGAPWARGARVLAVDPHTDPEILSAPSGDLPRGLTVAVSTTQADHIHADQRPDGQPPAVLVTVDDGR